MTVLLYHIKYVNTQIIVQGVSFLMILNGTDKVFGSSFFEINLNDTSTFGLWLTFLALSYSLKFKKIEEICRIITSIHSVIAK